MSLAAGSGLSLAPFRGLRFTAAAAELGLLLCPPYDVIDTSARADLLAQDPNNAVQVVLPQAPAQSAGAGPSAGTEPSARSVDSEDEADRLSTTEPYRHAAAVLQRWVDDGVAAVDAQPALYVYEMRVAEDGTAGVVTRGLLGAVELRDPDDGVILPHENTMAGPVADRLALMEATQANLEPIYLVYDGGGAASDVVAGVDAEAPMVEATTPDRMHHRLWAVTDAATIAAVAGDLAQRRALIADGHHRYATYRQLAERRRAHDGAGPWDRGLALLVDSSAYGPQVHPIHRVVAGLRFDAATAAALSAFRVRPASDLTDAMRQLDETGSGFAVVVTDGSQSAVITDPDPSAVEAGRDPGEPAVLLELDVTVLHRILVERAWQLEDNESTVGYAHSVEDAVAAAKSNNGLAVLLRATPVTAVSAVAAAGARMPRKSTFFTPKPASGMVMRRFVDA